MQINIIGHFVFLFNVLDLQESSRVPRKCDQYVFKESLMAQSAAGTKTDNTGRDGGKKKRASGMHQGVQRRSCMPGGSDSVMVPVRPFKIRIGSDPFPLHHSGSLSPFVCLLVTLNPFTEDARKEVDFFVLGY